MTCGWGLTTLHTKHTMEISTILGSYFDGSLLSVPLSMFFPLLAKKVFAVSVGSCTAVLGCFEPLIGGSMLHMSKTNLILCKKRAHMERGL